MAGKVHGVLGVHNLIAVKQLPSAFDVKSRIMAAIKRQADFDAAAVTVRTDGDKVFLGGKVKAWGDRRVAEQAAWAAPGVARVVDDIVVAN